MKKTLATLTLVTAALAGAFAMGPDALAAPSGGLPEAPGRLIVSLDYEDAGRLAQALTETKARLLRSDERLGFAVVDAPSAAGFQRALGGTVTLDERGYGDGHLVPGTIHVPGDPSWTSQWGPQALNMPQAWAIHDGNAVDPSGLCSDSSGVCGPIYRTVAVVDSGIAFPAHPDLNYGRIGMGFDYVDFDATPYDLNGHGTHVAGTIAAVSNNLVGIAGMAEVNLLVIRVLDASNAGWCSDFASGIMDAVAAQVDVINLSLNCNSDWPALFSAVAAAKNADIVVVAAAGNYVPANGINCRISGNSGVKWPANYAEVIAVGSIELLSMDPSSAPNFYRATVGSYSGSCRGSTPTTVSLVLPPTNQVDLCGPGVNILSTVPTYLAGFSSGYAYFTGTSMATPHVAATAALVKSFYYTGPTGGAGISEEHVRYKLYSTASTLTPNPAALGSISKPTPWLGGVAAPTATCGWGVVNPPGALA